MAPYNQPRHVDYFSSRGCVAATFKQGAIGQGGSKTHFPLKLKN